MIPTYKEPYKDGELRIGWASWDTGRYEERSIKYAYPDSSGKISRGSPELPFDVLVDMLSLAANQGELDEVFLTTATARRCDVSHISLNDLRDEKKTLSHVLARIQLLKTVVPWAAWQPVHDQLGTRLNEVKVEISKR